MTRPIVFMTDYGLADEFVGVCHGVMSRIAPGSRVIDLTHGIGRQNVLQGALVLARSVAFMPQDAVFVAVVDPGVGSPRRAVAIETASEAILVGPDNGVLSMAWLQLGDIARASEIRSDDVLLQPVSKTFHGRDVFAPAAAYLAAGFAFEDLGPAVLPATLETVELPGPMVTPGKVGARVVAVDGFGNVQLNAKPVDLDRAGLDDRLAVGGKSVPRVGSFSEIRDHALGMIVDSQGFLAFMVNRGNAADAMNLAPGDPVVIEAD